MCAVVGISGSVTFTQVEVKDLWYLLPIRMFCYNWVSSRSISRIIHWLTHYSTSLEQDANDWRQEYDSKKESQGGNAYSWSETQFNLHGHLFQLSERACFVTQIVLCQSVLQYRIFTSRLKRYYRKKPFWFSFQVNKRCFLKIKGNVNSFGVWNLNSVSISQNKAVAYNKDPFLSASPVCVRIIALAFKAWQELKVIHSVSTGQAWVPTLGGMKGSLV